MKKSLIKLITCAALFSNFMLPVMAQSAVNPVNFVVPAQNNDYSSSTPTFGIDLTSCVQVFNWQDYTDDLRSGRQNSNPFDEKGCVSQKNLSSNGTRTISGNTTSYSVGNTQIKVPKYKDFSNGSSDAKTTFGEMPVLGIFPNQNNLAQNYGTYNLDGSTKTASTPNDRSQLDKLSTIFDSKTLGEIYSTGGARTGMPRTPFTGPNMFVKNSSGEPVFQGGWCKVENGKIVVRNKFEGTYEGKAFSQDVNPADYGLDANNPAKTCGWSDSYKTTPSDSPLYDGGFVKDNNLQAYQFVYIVPFPKTQTECDSWFPKSFKDYDSCLAWFRNRYGTLLAGNNKTGSQLVYTMTYYAALNDIYTAKKGWTNPDITGPRSTFQIGGTLADSIAFGGHDEKSIRQAFNDTQTSYSVLVGNLNSSSDTIKENYRTLLNSRFEGLVRGANGFSTYLQ
jgi:hypothetical protein